MVFPIINDYKAAWSNSKKRLTTLDVEPVLDERGDPVFMAGNFAAVFKATKAAGGADGEATFAIKCFIRDLPDLERRHRAIEAAIARLEAKCFVDVRFISDELFVTSPFAGDGNYPVVVMPWIEGSYLGKVIAALSLDGDKNGLAALTKTWAKMCRELLRMGVAHGDLKHDNIFITGDDEIKLIDCEAMFVPELKGMLSLLLGGVHFQHPARDAKHYDQTLDHFSMLVITLSLRALTIEPELHQRYNNGENIILSRSDFNDPRRSKLFEHLMASPDALVREWTAALMATLNTPSIAVTGLENILKQAQKAPPEPVTGSGIIFAMKRLFGL